MARSKKQISAAHSPRIANRAAYHKFHVHEKLEVGVELVGSEVKSIRAGQASLGEGFARVDPAGPELFLHAVHIAPYANAPLAHEPGRTRKLLAHRREIAKLLTATQSKGATLIPLTMYFSKGRVKIELGVATGKKQHDQRQDIKERDAKRAIQRGMTRRII
jgi:SsrA-binding protein